MMLVNASGMSMVFLQLYNHSRLRLECFAGEVNYL